MPMLQKLKHLQDANEMPPTHAAILAKFFESYSFAVQQNGHNIQEYEEILSTFLDLVVTQLKHPYSFQPYHQAIRSPFDYYQFGLELLRPLVIFEKSTLSGLNYLDEMELKLANKENVILFANHQTEPDPQAISLLLEKTHSKFAEEMIFVAGHRVTSDPLAAPFSIGRNLLCIYSKKYIEDIPALKEERLQHNQKTMKKMAQLLSEGGKCIYVAPSGGRDRPNEKGILEVASFDPQSIEMFWLMARQAGMQTNFYPLSLMTYSLLPPPNSIEKALGEQRYTTCTPIHLAFGGRIDMENFPGSDVEDKKAKRAARTLHIWNLVKNNYNSIGKSD